MNYDLNKDFNAYLDLQYRFVSYEFTGLNNDRSPLDQTANLNFFNPKAGINYRLNGGNNFYGFVGIGNKEPNRMILLNLHLKADQSMSNYWM